MKYLVLLLILGSCKMGIEDSPRLKQNKDPSPFDMKCKTTSKFIGRCENIEVICYHLYGESLQCKFKEI